MSAKLSILHLGSSGGISSAPSALLDLFALIAILTSFFGNFIIYIVFEGWVFV